MSSEPFAAGIHSSFKGLEAFRFFVLKYAFFYFAKIHFSYFSHIAENQNVSKHYICVLWRVLDYAIFVVVHYSLC